ncbi:thioredoxin family protein, partial [Pseudomonas chlororaphis]|uniref:thioredoxin family protein n=1 Tax=Pseudomonas chlororaphis TaxID=587753 RepID=UPI0021E0821D
MSQDTPYIFDASTADFDQSVIENSFHKPVLVDFWAEWCAPCKALMPMLQQIAESYQGELLLAKVNCDIEQDIVARIGTDQGTARPYDGCGKPGERRALLHSLNQVLAHAPCG